VSTATAIAGTKFNASDLLRKIGLRRTPVRLGVLEVLAASTQPLGVPQVLEKLPEHTDTVTVYRTLNTFTSKKVVHRVRGEDRTWRYAMSSGGGTDHDHAPHAHPHFVCESCGSVECLEDSQIPANFVRGLKVADGYEVHYPEVTLHGVCPKCHA
jgi:Fur family ferric uptake transcriptional regulator